MRAKRWKPNWDTSQRGKKVRTSGCFGDNLVTSPPPLFSPFPPPPAHLPCQKRETSLTQEDESESLRIIPVCGNQLFQRECARIGMPGGDCRRHICVENAEKRLTSSEAPRLKLELARIDMIGSANESRAALVHAYVVERRTLLKYAQEVYIFKKFLLY